MAKRKTAVSDIIYELDNDDSELSSDDEVKQPKIIRLEANNSPNTTQSDSNTQSSCVEIIDVDSSTERVDEPNSPKVIRNGAKSPEEFIIIDEASSTASPKALELENNRSKRFNASIFNEDIIIDSPATNSDPGVAGCENRTPLVTVRFRDSRLAMNYKKKIKAFMQNLLKLHENETESDDDTDLELDIWPEDLTEDVPQIPADNLFFVDTDPCIDMVEDIPSYSQNTPLISNIEKESTPPPQLRRKGPICFNCDGSHIMRECTLPRNNARIAENRKAMTKIGRYHVEDDQKYGHLVPGRLSGQLRHALGLKRNELPMHIYRMRLLGYPPGWLEDAKISHSGIALFDAPGQATLGPDDDEGELIEPGSKDKFDIKKILDLPGFNVPTSSKYKDEGHKIGMEMSDQDSKMAMLQVLAPNAMKAYKRKKLTLFPSAPGLPQCTAEMDIDSGDEVAEFPTQPPLPDDAPPPPPPPPRSPPPLLVDSPPPLRPTEEPKNEIPTTDANAQYLAKKPKRDTTESDDDVAIVEVIKVNDIPVPIGNTIIIDVDADISEPESGLVSPSLDDLEQKKQLLLSALDTVEDPVTEDTVENIENNKDVVLEITEPADITKPADITESEKINAPADIIKATDISESVDITETEDITKSADIIESIDITESVDVTKSTDITETVDITESTDINESADITESADVNTEAGEEDSIQTTEIPSEIEVVNDKVDNGSSDKVEDNSADKTDIELSSVASTSKDDKEVRRDREKVEVVPSSNEDTPKVGEEERTVNDSDLPRTPVSAMGRVRGTDYGTPVMNIASPYLKLPSDDKFAKDICDVINFENLPNSTGKYKQISTLLKKVKSEVDRIQES